MDYSRAQKLVLDLVAAHGLTDWRVQFDTAKKRLGQCRYDTKTLSFSKPLILVNDEHELIDTVLHEIAHAFAGPTAGHGPEWRKVARRLGARPEATSSNAKMVPGRYQGICSCGRTFQKYRAPRTVRLCAACRGRIAWVDTETGRDVG